MNRYETLDSRRLVATLSPRWDITSLIEHYAGIQVVSSAVVRNVKENHSNCPWCGGHDRFITRPETGQFSCAIRSSGCGRHGDGINFLREYCGMSMREAIEELALENISFSQEKQAHTQPLPGTNKKWQEAAATIVDLAERRLWHPEIGKKALAYLHSRALTDQTIKHFHLGYMPLNKQGRWAKFDFSFFGIDPNTLTQKQRDKGGINVPDGILMPWSVGGKIWKLTVKRPNKSPDYGQIVGSSECLFNGDSIQYNEPAMLVESEFCAMSVWQEGKDLVNCVATGGDKKCRNGRWPTDLTLASFILQAFDEDESGDRAAEYWTKTLKYCMRWSPLIHKDPNDFLKAHVIGQEKLTLRDWIENGVYSGQIEFGIIPDPIF